MSTSDKEPSDKASPTQFWKDYLIIPHLSKLTLISLVAVFLGSVGLDQVSKAHIQATMLEYEDATNSDLYRGSLRHLTSIGTPDRPGQATNFFVALNLHYSRNKGAAFSMLDDLDDRFRVPFFYVITVLAVILIFFYFQSTPPEQRWTRFGLALILSGAIGNFLDRLNYGYVVDFIDVDWDILGWQHDFAIFNVADVAINIGVICLVIDFFVGHRQEAPAKESPSTATPSREDSASMG